MSEEKARLDGERFQCLELYISARLDIIEQAGKNRKAALRELRPKLERAYPEYAVLAQEYGRQDELAARFYRIMEMEPSPSLR